MEFLGEAAGCPEGSWGLLATRFCPWIL